MTKLKTASELAKDEISPCDAINAQAMIYRTQEAMIRHGKNVDATRFQEWREAERVAASANASCRRCNPTLRVCFNACSIPSAAIEKQKGYTA